jgi:NAD(P)-dependent dehydrogenase (short-subunit alcohol dehydrogenase family)
MLTSKDLPPSTSSLGATMVKSQLRTKAKYPPKDTNLSQKVAIITGANTGLGLESARQFLSYKLSHLIITARTEAKGKAALLQLQSEYPNASIQVWPLEMNLYDSIRSFVKRVESELPRLDIVVLNAGVSKTTLEVVPSTGHDEVMQVNYLSTVLLSILLLPTLKSKSPPGSPGRLSIVNSGTSLFSAFFNNHTSAILKSFDDPKTAPPPGMDDYSASKLMGQFFLYKLADYISADDVIVNLVDPGLTRGTQFGRELNRVVAILADPILRAIARSPLQGASTYLDASVVKGKESHGCFVMDWEIRP